MAFYLKSTAYTRMFKMIDSADHFSKKTGLTCTVNISKSGAAFGAAGGTVTEVANGWYKVALNTTDTNTAGDLAFYITATGADDTDFVDQVVDPTAANLGVNVVNWNNTVVATPATAGIPDVNVKNINNAAAATPGASGGILISGSNSGTTTFGAITCTGSFTVSDGFLVSRSTANTSAITATGNGTGSGFVATSGSGATGDGIQATAASTNGKGVSATGTGTGAGFLITGGATGAGLSLVGGGTSGDALLTATTSGHGATFAGTGTTKHGINATGGATTSHGISATGGGVGHGILATSGGGATGDGIRGTAASTNGNGFNAIGVGTGAGFLTTGGATGIGFSVVGGGTSGDGIKIVTTSGHGINSAPVGTGKHGMFLTGGNGATADGLSCVAGTGGVPIRGNITGNITGTIDTVTTATNVTTLNGIAANVITAASIADGAIDRATFAADTGLVTIRSNTAQAGAAGTITLDASASATDGLYVGLRVLLTGGTGAGQVRTFTAYVGATKVGSVDWNWTTTPDATSTFAILPSDGPAVNSSLQVATTASDPWATALPGAYGAGTAGRLIGRSLPDIVAGSAGGLFIAGTNAATTITTALTTTFTGNLTGSVASVTGNVGGNVTGSVGSIAAGGIAAASFAAGAINAAAIATDAIDADALATDAVNEIADGMLNRNMATGTDSSSDTVRTMRSALRVLRNKWSISGTTITYTKEDDATTSHTAALTASAGADPIVASDPG